MIRPLGLGGRKKVFRAMMDRKVPRDLRRRTPVVVGRTGEVAWIPFGELAEGFGVGRETGRILKVEVAKRP
jgi:tRNA(Ile)-lysidine synthase